MGVNPEELYNQQKRIQQDHDRASGKDGKHGTIETWKIEQENADRGAFVPDPADQKKPGFFKRLLGLFGKKS